MEIPNQYIALDNRRIPLHYRCGYRSVSVGMDGISRSILKFKSGDAVHVAAWTEVAQPAMQGIGLAEGDTSSCVRWDIRETAILWRSALKPMDALCLYIAERVGRDDVPDLLRKKKKNLKLTGLSRLERERTLEDAYESAPVFSWGEKRIWIMDDVVTTGSTIRAIATALQKSCPSVELKSFCLARNDGYPGHVEQGRLLGKNYGWDTRRGWVAMEENVGYRKE